MGAPVAAMSAPLRRRIALFCLVLAVALLFHRVLLGEGVLYFRDVCLNHLPVRIYTTPILKSGHLPLWNPYLSGGLPLAANQVHYSLAHRSIESDGTLEAAKELGVTIVAYTPLEYGLLTGIYQKNPALLEQKLFYRRRRLQSQLEATRPLVAALEEIAAQHQVTPAQVALNWLVTFHGDTVVTIPGATKVSHVEQSAGALTFILTEEELHRLDETSQQFR